MVVTLLVCVDDAVLDTLEVALLVCVLVTVLERLLVAVEDAELVLEEV